MQPLMPLIVGLGALLVGAAPAWFVLVAQAPAGRRRTRAGLLLTSYVLATAGLGFGWILGLGALLGQDPRPALAFSGLLLFAVLPNVLLKLRKDLRAAGRARWKETHPADDVLPETRAERRAATEIELVRTWSAEAHRMMRTELEDRGWIAASTVAGLDAVRPSVNLGGRAASSFVARQPAAVRAACDHWNGGTTDLAAAMNREFLVLQKERLGGFFASVESSPLTDEQIEAVVCGDDRVRLVAAAGSGKTSTLTAKAVYLIESGFVAPDRVLVLAFNRDAADEARRRLVDRLGARGVSDAHGVDVLTFHTLGLRLTGRARGRKPSVPSWAEGDALRREHVAQIVDRLRKQDRSFDQRWRLFHVLYGRWMRLDEKTFGRADDERLRTRSGDVVRSRGEQLIADWLWFHGVEFEYERPYMVDLATAERRQYAPDFYYPSADLWHEHFALDRDGAAPPQFDGYLDGVLWKRAVHHRHGTTLIETTTAQIDDGTVLVRLEAELRAAGVHFDPQSLRNAAPVDPVESGRTHEVLQRLLMAARAQGLDEAALSASAARLLSGAGLVRGRLLLDLFEPVRREWERDLDDVDGIDFDGMVHEANEALESGLVLPEYDVILVDEFQDLSPEFGRLLRNLLRRPRSRLFAVGDDWQAINGFAGAHDDEILRFHERFGEGTTLRLQRTFRSAQAICDVAGAFVMANEAQLRKDVVSAAPPFTDGVRIRAVHDRASQRRLLQRYFEHLQASIDRRRRDGHVEPNRSVLVLGRYGWLNEFLPERPTTPSLDVRFRTVHSAKGLEADHVVVLDVVEGAGGFPAMKVDDPVLGLARPQAESYPHAEERRLLYVALTRARRSVVVLTEGRRLSPFVRELVELGSPMKDEFDAPVEVCPSCRRAILVPREGSYGPFQCCAAAQCSYTRAAVVTVRTTTSVAPVSRG